MNVTVNLNGVFAKIDNAQELKECANDIIMQIKTAYDERLAELLPKTKSKSNTVDVEGAKAAKGAKGVKAAKPTATKKAVAKRETAKPTPKPTAKQTPTKKASKVAAVPSKTAKTTEKKPTVEQIKIASLTRAQIKAMNIKFEKYSDKCMLLTGETKPIKDEIKAIGGAHWNSTLKGWFVKNDNAKLLAKALKIKIA